MSLVRRAVVALLTLVAACCGMAAPAHAMPGPEFFGLNAQPMLKLGFVPPERWGPYLDAMAQGGIRVARVDAAWAFAEPSAPAADGTRTYVWNRPERPTQSLDLVARELAARGIRMLPVLATPPSWAAGPGTRMTPDRYGDFAAFAGAFAARYGSRGTFWAENPGLPAVPPTDYEIWTEANSANMWTGRSDPAAYMAALPAVSAAIKANAPGGRVLASVGWEGFDGFVREIYARGAKGVIDGVGFHPYAPHAPAILELTIRLRRTLTQVGDPGLPIELTETGQPVTFTGPGGPRAGSGAVSDAARAATQSLTGDALARSDCGVGAFQVYTLVASESRLEPGGEGYMGVLRLADARPNATGAALFAAAQRWRARPRSGLVLCGEGATAPANLLSLNVDLQHPKPTCATGTVTYEGNPIEGAFLVLRTADGRSSRFEIDAFGKGEVCIPDGPPIWSFDVRAEVEDVAASPTYRCPVLDGPCLVVAQATDVAPEPPGAGCRWSLKPKVLGARGSRAKVQAALSCAPKATRVPFAIAVRERGKTRAGKALRRVTVPQGTMRTFTLPRRVGADDRVVITHAADAKTGVPALTATARTIGGATGDGAEGCEWKVETRVVRRKRARSQVRIRVACIPPGAKSLTFTASVLRKGRSKASRVRMVTLQTGREQTFTLKARLKRGDQIDLLHTGDTRRGTPRISSRATVSRAAARTMG
ncbi:MAG: hypothetical protein JHC84_05675 [Solirubrobacteraceae bacterium]|nr:hypothetical protein [Solirubrobacteraceae bacterium]